jgi:hypothetical protein
MTSVIQVIFGGELVVEGPLGAQEMSTNVEEVGSGGMDGSFGMRRV